MTIIERINRASVTFDINGTRVRDAQISGCRVLGHITKPGGYEISFSARQRADLTGPNYERLSNEKTEFDLVIYSFVSQGNSIIPVQSTRYRACTLKANTDYAIDGKMYSVTVTAVSRDNPENLL